MAESAQRADGMQAAHGPAQQLPVAGAIEVRRRAGPALEQREAEVAVHMQRFTVERQGRCHGNSAAASSIAKACSSRICASLQRAAR